MTSSIFGLIGNIVDGLLNREKTLDNANVKTDNGLLNEIAADDGGLRDGLFEEGSGAQQKFLNITDDKLSNIKGISNNDTNNMLILKITDCKES